MTRSDEATVNTTRTDLAEWVSQIAKLTRPDRVHWVTGSAEERQMLIDVMLEAGTIEQLNPELRPDSYVARSDASDVARVESRTFICSEHQRDAVPSTCP
jgi:phosphoenolpyruvate carboxykinase (GTP)